MELTDQSITEAASARDVIKLMRYSEAIEGSSLVQQTLAR